MEQQHHYGWMAIVLIIFGTATYIFTVNRPDIDNLAKGSAKVEVHNSAFSHIISLGEGGCAHMSNGKIDKPILKEKK